MVIIDGESSAFPAMSWKPVIWNSIAVFIKGRQGHAASAIADKPRATFEVGHANALGRFVLIACRKH